MTFAYLILTAVWLWASQPAAADPAPACHEWHECQRLALDAYASGKYEQFHDLAWRTVQTGPARDPDLMFMLARAQSLSGRPHDALVMLERLVAAGFPVGAVAEDADFRAVRGLRQWQELENLLAPAAPAPTANAAAPAVTAPSLPNPSVPKPSAAPAIVPPTPTPTPTPTSTPPRRGEEALRIHGAMYGAAGLAYDRVSSRFVVADADRRKLVIIDERSRRAIDLVTAASAGFYDITGFEIDPARGDLWVVSAEPPAASGDRAPETALHKLQLVSGRPLERIPVPAEWAPCRLTDVAVTPDGRVLVLDSAGNRLMRFRPSTRTFARVAALSMESPASVAPAGDRIAYVAHASGIARVDTVTGSVEPLAGGRGVELTGFERIRWAKDSLVGVQRVAGGTRRLVRIKIADGRAAAAEVVDDDLAAGDDPVATVSGDELYLLVREPADQTGDVVIRRSRLR